MLVWIAGGLITLAGALVYAELGAAMPEAGGQYVYLREAFGPLSGFLFGWIRVYNNRNTSLLLLEEEENS